MALDSKQFSLSKFFQRLGEKIQKYAHWTVQISQKFKKKKKKIGAIKMFK